MENKQSGIEGAIYKDLDIPADIKKKRLEWIGYVVGMDQGRIVKKICEGKPEGSIRRERTRLRWLEEVGKDVRELKVKGWRQKAVNREEWVSVIQQAKALRGPQSKGVSNICIWSALMMNYYMPIQKKSIFNNLIYKNIKCEKITF